MPCQGDEFLRRRLLALTLVVFLLNVADIITTVVLSFIDQECNSLDCHVYDVNFVSITSGCFAFVEVILLACLVSFLETPDDENALDPMQKVPMKNFLTSMVFIAWLTCFLLSVAVAALLFHETFLPFDKAFLLIDIFLWGARNFLLLYYGFQWQALHIPRTAPNAHNNFPLHKRIPRAPIVLVGLSFATDALYFVLTLMVSFIKFKDYTMVESLQIILSVLTILYKGYMTQRMFLKVVGKTKDYLRHFATEGQISADIRPFSWLYSRQQDYNHNHNPQNAVPMENINQAQVHN